MRYDKSDPRSYLDSALGALLRAVSRIAEGTGSEDAVRRLQTCRAEWLGIWKPEIGLAPDPDLDAGYHCMRDATATVGVLMIDAEAARLSRAADYRTAAGHIGSLRYALAVPGGMPMSDPSSQEWQDPSVVVDMYDTAMQSMGRRGPDQSSGIVKWAAGVRRAADTGKQAAASLVVGGTDAACRGWAADVLESSRTVLDKEDCFADGPQPADDGRGFRWKGGLFQGVLNGAMPAVRTKYPDLCRSPLDMAAHVSEDSHRARRDMRRVTEDHAVVTAAVNALEAGAQELNKVWVRAADCSSRAKSRMAAC